MKNLRLLKKVIVHVFVVMLSSPRQHVCRNILSTTFPLSMIAEKEVNHSATRLTMATQQTFTLILTIIRAKMSTHATVLNLQLCELCKQW